VICIKRVLNLLVWLGLLLPALVASSGVASAQLPDLGDGGPGPVKAPHLTVEMVSLAPGIAPGGTQTIGLVFTLEEHWHVYWINAGDSGEPPEIKWTLPKGITTGAMQFPTPTTLPLGPKDQLQMDFGYEDEVAFPVTVSAATGTPLGPAHLDAKVNWLVCREVCIPGKAHLGLTLNVMPGAAPGAPVGALGQALSNLPKPLPANMSFSVMGGAKQFVLTLKTGTREDDAEFYPFQLPPAKGETEASGVDGIQNAADQQVHSLPDGVRLDVQRSADGTPLPAMLRGVIKLSETESYVVSAPVVAGEAAGAATTPKAGALTLASTLSAIGLALLGGIILNLMPCVFPVLFLKGLALVNSSGEERRHMRGHGLVYTLGILVSFWVVVAALLLARAGGRDAGWGFQLQSPAFVAILAGFLFFFALSLAGQFDLGLSLTSAGGGLARKEGYAGSFFTGVLATVVATPCTAPLMGAAIGFALAQPAPITFAVFTALALGLALPYLLLTLQPAWTRWLPRPGAWMEVLKQLTAVPLFATVIWLVWVYGRLFSSTAGEGSDHIARMLLALLVLAIAGWTLNRWPAKTGSAIAAVVLAILALTIPLRADKVETQTWAPYTQATLDEARKTGKPVFIDFTAAWCLSCQVNEKVVLHSDEVKKLLAENHYTLLRADWTRYEPGITNELASIGRSGVPTYVIYPAGNRPADVLPELLTKGEVVTAIGRDSK
jgi:thiol:disulfide interchange protein/DsbC/DsbD-like thiol-disulfide interchange protein